MHQRCEPREKELFELQVVEDVDDDEPHQESALNQQSRSTLLAWIGVCHNRSRSYRTAAKYRACNSSD